LVCSGFDIYTDRCFRCMVVIPLWPRMSNFCSFYLICLSWCCCLLVGALIIGCSLLHYWITVFVFLIFDAFRLYSLIGFLTLFFLDPIIQGWEMFLKAPTKCNLVIFGWIKLHFFYEKKQDWDKILLIII